MSCTVFAAGEGLFHKNSGGSGKAYPDVCLSPPPPPTGPVPIPYPNSLKASDLTRGSKSVKVDGAATALEDRSSIKTSSGDEGGTQGGNVVTHKTKGKGYFMHWSFDVRVEGKGVGRHGDPMGQNSASSPPGAADFQASVKKATQDAHNPSEPCEQKYVAKKHRHNMTKAQYKAVAKGPCWQCGKKRGKFTPDHQPPVFLRWYAGGCHKSEEDWKKDFQSTASVYPHCSHCSNKQGGNSSQESRRFRDIHEYFAGI